MHTTTYVVGERYSLCPSVFPLSLSLSLPASISLSLASFLYVKRVDLYSETDQVGLHTQFISRGEAHGNYLSLLCGRAGSRIDVYVTDWLNTL